MPHRGFVVLVLLFFALSCGGGGGSSPTAPPAPPPPIVNVAGTWDGTLNFGTILVAVTMTFSQMSATVTGTWLAPGAGGSVNGTISGSTFTFSGIQLTPCAGTFAGSGTINAAVTQITGSYSGSDCAGFDSVTFVITR